LNIHRQIKYYYLKFIRLKGDPHELALGISLGIFTGMMPIMPFQIALAVTLAILFKGSKITAALGTWVSNPLNWYFLYYFSYKIGSLILGLSEKNRVSSGVMESIHQGEEAVVVVLKIAGAGGTIISAFVLGGLVMGIICAAPSYFIFLKIFRIIKDWRERRRYRKHCQQINQQK
jgi:uncharacterized protein (DUF2062 family)